MKTIFGYIFLPIHILLCFGLSSCNTDPVEATSTAEEKVSKNAPTEVRIHEAKKQTFSKILRCQGVIEAPERSTVASNISGRVQKIFIRNGAQVKEGQLLIQLDESALQIEIQKAQADLARTKEEYKKLFVEYGGKWGISSSLADTLQDALKARSGFQYAEVRLNECRWNLEQCAIKALSTGIFSDLSVQQGEYIPAQKAMGTIYNPNALEVRAEIIQSDYSLLSPQMGSDWTPLSDPTKKIKGILAEINPAVNEKGMIQIRLKLQNAVGVIPGMNVSGALFSEVRENILVPKEALVYHSGKPVIFVVENNKARWKDIEIGMENGKEVEIIKGLELPATVIISNNLQLAHDAPVHITK